MQYDAKESLSDTTPNVDGDKGTPTFEHIFSSSGTVTFEHPQLGKIHSDSPIQIKKISTGDEGIEFIGSHAKGSTKVETIPPPEVMDKIKTYQGRKSRSEIATYKIEKAARDKSYEIDRERRYREKIHSGALPGNFPYEKFK
jgi:hypothetical protein